MPSARRVVHHPRRHPYVDRIAGHHDDDPAIDDVWDVDALVAARIDAVQLHAGFEHIGPDDMWAWCTALKECGIRLAHTVHHIDNPYLVDQRPHHRRVAALVRHADELDTLTPSASAEIAARWGRRALVVPYPPLVVDAVIDQVRRRPPIERPVLVWLGAPRPSIDLDVVVDVVERVAHPVELVARLDGWDALDDDGRDRIVAAVARSASGELVITGCPTNAELVEVLAQRPAIVLPEAWGTHSGLVRLATDLGVPALVPAVGCHADQGALVAPASQLADLVTRVVGPPDHTDGQASDRMAVS